MVQTYGVAADSEHGTNNDLQHTAESDALLGGDSTVRKPKSEGHATLQSCVGNLANTIIGSGACYYAQLIMWAELIRCGIRDVDVSFGMTGISALHDFY